MRLPTPRASRRASLRIPLRGALLLIAATALVLGACTDGGDADEPTPTATPTTTASPEATPGDSNVAGGGGIEPANPDAPPPGTLVSSEGSVQLGLGTYCWSPPLGSGNPGMCVDAIGIITGPEDLHASAGETLSITGEQGSLPWPPMTIAHATLYPLPAEPVDAQADFRAWQPEGGEVTLETEETVGEHLVTLPEDLDPGEYLLSLSYTAGPDRGSDAQYGAVIVIE